jgi:hypothetical protein
MKNSDEVSTFKIGDWIIIKEKYLKDYSISSNTKNSLIREYYSYPQRIKKISNLNESGLTYFLDDTGHSTKHIERFRLATESEINSQQIKDVFLK